MIVDAVPLIIVAVPDEKRQTNHIPEVHLFLSQRKPHMFAHYVVPSPSLDTCSQKKFNFCSPSQEFNIQRSRAVVKAPLSGTHAVHCAGTSCCAVWLPTFLSKRLLNPKAKLENIFGQRRFLLDPKKPVYVG